MGRQQGYFHLGFNLAEVILSVVLVLSVYCTGIVLCVKMRPKHYAMEPILKTQQSKSLLHKVCLRAVVHF